MKEYDPRPRNLLTRRAFLGGAVGLATGLPVVLAAEQLRQPRPPETIADLAGRTKQLTAMVAAYTGEPPGRFGTPSFSTQSARGDAPVPCPPDSADLKTPLSRYSSVEAWVNEGRIEVEFGYDAMAGSLYEGQLPVVSCLSGSLTKTFDSLYVSGQLHFLASPHNDFAQRGKDALQTVLSDYLTADLLRSVEKPYYLTTSAQDVLNVGQVARHQGVTNRAMQRAFLAGRSPFDAEVSQLFRGFPIDWEGISYTLRLPLPVYAYTPGSRAETLGGYTIRAGCG